MTMWGWRSSRTALIGLALVAFAVFCIAPLVFLVAGAFAAVRGHCGTGTSRCCSTFDSVACYLRPRYSGSALPCVSTLVGAPLGFALARVTLPFKPLLRVALAAPALLPTYVVALAWTYLVAPIAGEWAYSVVSAIVVMTVVCYPLSMLATEVALRRVEPRLEEAALLVASRAAVLRRITLPLAAPAILPRRS